MNYFLIAVLMSLTSPIFCQKKSFDFGIKTGGGFSFNINSDVLANVKPNISYGLTNGFSFKYNSSKTFFFQTEILIDRKTFHINRYSNTTLNLFRRDGSNTSTDPSDLIYGGDVITLAVLPGFKTKGKLKFLLCAGIFTGLFINEHITYLPSESYPEKEVYNELFKKTIIDFGLSVSVRLEYPINDKFIFTLENRMNLTLYNSQKVWYDFANNNLMLGFAYRLNKKAYNKT